jgi:hypothetical protein
MRGPRAGVGMCELRRRERECRLIGAVDLYLGHPSLGFTGEYVGSPFLSDDSRESPPTAPKPTAAPEPTNAPATAAPAQTAPPATAPPPTKARSPRHHPPLRRSARHRTAAPAQNASPPTAPPPTAAPATAAPPTTTVVVVLGSTTTTSARNALRKGAALHAANSDSDDSSDSTNYTPWIIAAVVIAVAAIVAGVLIARNRRKKRAAGVASKPAGDGRHPGRRWIAEPGLAMKRRCGYRAAGTVPAIGSAGAPSYEDSHTWVRSLPWVVERPCSLDMPGVRCFGVDCVPFARRQLWLLTGMEGLLEADGLGLGVIVPVDHAPRRITRRRRGR